MYTESIKRIVKIAAFSFIIVLASYLVFGYPAWAETGKQAKWTYMIYMDGDNNLEESVTTDIENELAPIGSNKDVNVVALADRIPEYDSQSGDWTTSKLFYVTKNTVPDPEHAIADWGERNMGDPRTLVDFIKWSRQNYPAEHYALILWDHGWGWHPGYTMRDDTSDGDALEQEEIIAAMKEAGPVDVVGYDACEEQMIEVQSTWRQFAGAIAASQEDVWWRGFRHDFILAELQKDPSMTGEELAVVMAKSMIDKTCSAVVLDKDWDTLVKAVDQLSSALLNGLPKYKDAYDLAYQHAQGTFDPANKDLYDTALELKAHVPDRVIQEKCNAVIKATDQVVLYEWHKQKKYRNAHGIGIFWPKTSDDYTDKDYYKSIAFSDLTHWDEFIDAYMNYKDKIPKQKNEEQIVPNGQSTGAAVTQVSNPQVLRYATVTGFFKDSSGKYIIMNENGKTVRYHVNKRWDFFAYDNTQSIDQILKNISDGTIVKFTSKGEDVTSLIRIADDYEGTVPVGHYYIEDIDYNTLSVKITDGLWSQWFTCDKDTVIYDWTDDYNLGSFEKLKVGDQLVADPINFDTANKANQVQSDPGRFLLTGNNKNNILKILVVEN